MIVNTALRVSLFSHTLLSTHHVPGSVLSAVGEIILFLRTWNLVEKKVMYTRNYSTRQHEICAKIGAQPWYIAKAKE